MHLLRNCSFYLPYSFLLFGIVAGQLAAQDLPPNILFITVDDLNDDLQPYGHPLVKTPNITRLAARGLRFDAAYVQFPVCTPSRSSFLTGLYPDQTKVTRNGVWFRDALPDVTTLPQLFKENGYHTARTGKIFHQGVPGGIGSDGLDDPASWDERVNPRGIDRDDALYASVNTIAPDPATPASTGGTLSWLSLESEDEEHTDAMVADTAIELLEKNNPDITHKPLFLAVGFYRPHTPYIAPKRFFDMYPLEELRLAINPENYRDEIPVAALSDNRYEAEITDDTKLQAIQAYYATITFMDAQLGRVLDKLDDLGLSDNTIVVFLSDHGYSLGEHDLWQKGNLFENTLRTPLIVAAPQASVRGGATSSLVEFVDLYPTLAELSRIPVPRYIRGESFAAILNDPEAVTRESAFSQQRSRAFRTRPEWRGRDVMGYSVRTRDFRYTEWNGGRHGVQLYDFAHDPGEFENLAGDHDYQDVEKQLRELLRRRILSAEVPVQ